MTAPDWFLPLPELALGTVLPLSEVVRLMPSLDREVRQWTGYFDSAPGFALERCAPAEDETKRRWTFSGRGDNGELHHRFGSPEAMVNGSVVIAPADFVPQVAQSFVFDKVGRLLVREPLADNVRLAPLQVMFVVSYALSMLARYRPSHWMEILSGVGRDRMFPLVHAFLDFVQEWFPELAADHLQYAAKCDGSMIPNTRET